MPVIKHEQFRPMIKEAVVLDLGDIGRQAERITAAAQARAERIEAEAHTRGQELARSTGEAARVAAHAQGLKAGNEEGQRQGREAAFAQMSNRLAELETGILRAAETLESAQASLEREARQAVIDLALRLAQRIVHRAIQVDPSLVVDQVAAALTHVLGRYDVTVALHPDDLSLVGEALPKLQQRLPQLTHIKLTEDPAVERGGCAVRYGQGEIDATIDTQLKRAVELLLPASKGTEP